MVGRAIRNLGNRNVLTFCNDNRLRICHICGRMKGRVWIEPGDIVLLSLRDFSAPTESDSDDDKKNTIQKVGAKRDAPPSSATGKEVNRGDIVAKYAPDHLSKLRREKGVNPKLFMKLETMDGMVLEEVGVDKTRQMEAMAEDDCGFVIEDDEESGEGSEEEEEKKKPKSKDHGTQVKGGRVAESKGIVKEALDIKDMVVDDAFIDDI